MVTLKIIHTLCPSSFRVHGTYPCYIPTLVFTTRWCLFSMPMLKPFNTAMAILSLSVMALLISKLLVPTISIHATGLFAFFSTSLSRQPLSSTLWSLNVPSAIVLKRFGNIMIFNNDGPYKHYSFKCLLLFSRPIARFSSHVLAYTSIVTCFLSYSLT